MITRDQTNRRNADIASGALIGLGGLKGELVAIRKAGAEKGCVLPTQDPELTAALDPRPVGQREEQ